MRKSLNTRILAMTLVAIVPAIIAGAAFGSTEDSSSPAQSQPGNTDSTIEATVESLPEETRHVQPASSATNAVTTIARIKPAGATTTSVAPKAATTSAAISVTTAKPAVTTVKPAVTTIRPVVTPPAAPTTTKAPTTTQAPVTTQAAAAPAGPKLSPSNVISKRGPFEQTPREWVTIWRVASTDTAGVFAQAEQQLYSQGWSAWWTSSTSGEFAKGSAHISMNAMDLVDGETTLVISYFPG